VPELAEVAFEKVKPKLAAPAADEVLQVNFEIPTAAAIVHAPRPGRLQVIEHQRVHHHAQAGRREQRDAGVVLLDVRRHRVQALDGQILAGLAELAGVELEAERFDGGQPGHRAQRLIDGRPIRLASEIGQVGSQILHGQHVAGGQLGGGVDEVPLSVGTPVGGDRAEQQQQCQARYRPTHTHLPRAGRLAAT
jgi:hypothetical protein